MSKDRNITKMRKSGKLNVFLIFLRLSVVFLVLTKLSKDYTQKVDFNLKAINVPEDQVILEDSTSLIQVTLRTYGFKFLKYVFNKPRLTIDVKQLTSDGQTYLWTKENGLAAIVAQFDTNVEIEAIEPDSLRLKYTVNAVKTVPVKLRSQISYSSGYNVIDSLVYVPDSIKIIGPKIILDTIYGMTSEELILENVDRTINTKVQLVLPESEPKLDFSQTEVNVSATVERFTEGSVRVPVILRNVPEGLSVNYYPKEINVIYYTSLSNFKTISSNSFIVACDFSYVKDGHSFLTPQITKMPEGIKGVRLSTDKIEYIITQ